MNLYDKRNDIFDIAKVPKVLWVYRGDTYEVEVRLKISAANIYKLVFNTEQLNASIELSLVSTSEHESVWLLTISKAQSMMLDAKQHTFTITVMKSATEYLTMYKGILNVNNAVYSNSPYLNPIVQDRKPTVNDSEHMIGMLWIDTSTNSVYALANIVNQDAIWRDLTNENIFEKWDPLVDGDSHFIGEVPPDDVKRYRVWLDYSDDDIGVMFGGGGVVPMSEKSTLTDELFLILDAAGEDEGLIIETDSEWLLVPEQGETLIYPDETGEETLLIQNDEDELGEILNMLGDGVIPEGTTWPPREDLIPLDDSGQSDDLIIETEPEQLILPEQEEELIFLHDAGEEMLLIQNDENENLLF